MEKVLKIQIPEDEEVWNQHLAAKVYTIAVAPEKTIETPRRK